MVSFASVILMQDIASAREVSMECCKFSLECRWCCGCFSWADTLFAGCKREAKYHLQHTIIQGLPFTPRSFLLTECIFYEFSKAVQKTARPFLLGIMLDNHKTEKTAKIITAIKLFIVIIFFSSLFVYYLKVNLWDYDFWWHAATGRYIVTEKHLPDKDPFSFTSELQENKNAFP